MSTLKRIYFLALFLALGSSLVSAQRLTDKAKGNHFELKKGLMDGNLVGTVYYNMGEVADWLNDPSRSGVWPKGTNHTYIDGVAIVVQAETPDPLDNTKVIHPLETNYYEYTRHDPATGVTYGWWPLPNYASRFQPSPAQSTESSTWPTHWPDRPSDWDGRWNGFFGKGVQNADVESYFVFDDNEDREYLLSHSFYPDRQDSSRGGLGMQVHARGFQWSQVLAEDVIFWLYEITNMGTTDYRKTLFAQYVDWGIGGHDNSSNNAGDYNEQLNLSYAWSTVPFGSPGSWSPVGYCGYAFLESPGISDDHRDNDRDGLTDERRDNNAQTFISSPFTDPFLVDALQDTAAFRRFYGYGWKTHWDADENCNWRIYSDLNANGHWDPGEALNDDVGTDGIGPFDEGYTGPDFDGSEGDGRPEQGEPNFGILDKDESDQLGLTGFIIAPVHTYDLNNDERNWTAFSAAPQPHGQSLVGVNLGNWFSSYLFHLYGRDTYTLRTGQTQEAGETERFSMGLIYGLNANDLFLRKRTVQQIYNANYRFAKPPDKPLVKAIAGDRKVTLYWDSRAEQTYDAFYQKYNFEGYRIYRSTEPNFLENQIITDAYGRPTFRQPLAQYDVVDGVKGLHPITVNGAAFYLGDDTGLQHSFVDSTVQNGQTYYYAVAAYDQGFTTTTVSGDFLGIPPSETTTRIITDLNGNVKTDVNTAVVVPRAPSAGYVAPQFKDFVASGPGTGSVTATVLDPDSVKDNRTFRLEFQDSTAFHDNPKPYYRFIDEQSGDTLIHLTRLTTDQEQTGVFNGFAVNIKNDPNVVVDQSQTGWVNGSSNYIVQVGFDSRYAPAYQARRVNYPADFEITFTGKGQGDLSFPSSSFSLPQPSDIVVNNLTEHIDHFQFILQDNNNDSAFNVGSSAVIGDAIFLVAGDSAGKPATNFAAARKSWSVTFIKDTLIPESQQRPPQPGDVYRIVTKKPFRTGEYVQFTTTSPKVDQAKAALDIRNIAVVPNPYVGAASWEPQSATVGRGDRRIYFIHLPGKCTIRIFTMSGHLVQTLEHDSSIDDGQESWDLVSRDGMNIAFGVYVYQVDAPNMGTFIDKFAVMK
ncbi:MAG TPA: hypothetical protein VL633_01410 [Bacteroidota bacterium]|nr:hypothetical protein [Bacteroidota bacterium]